MRRREYRMLEWPALIKFEVQNRATTANPIAGTGLVLNSKFTTQPNASKLTTVNRMKSSNLMPAVSFRKLIRFTFGIKKRIVGQSTGRERSTPLFWAYR